MTREEKDRAVDEVLARYEHLGARSCDDESHSVPAPSDARVLRLRQGRRRVPLLVPHRLGDGRRQAAVCGDKPTRETPASAGPAKRAPAGTAGVFRVPSGRRGRARTPSRARPRSAEPDRPAAPPAPPPPRAAADTGVRRPSPGTRWQERHEIAARPDGGARGVIRGRGAQKCAAPSRSAELATDRLREMRDRRLAALVVGRRAPRPARTSSKRKPASRRRPAPASRCRARR